MRYFCRGKCTDIDDKVDVFVLHVLIIIENPHTRQQCRLSNLWSVVSINQSINQSCVCVCVGVCVRYATTTTSIPRTTYDREINDQRNNDVGHCPVRANNETIDEGFCHGYGAMTELDVQGHTHNNHGDCSNWMRRDDELLDSRKRS